MISKDGPAAQMKSDEAEQLENTSSQGIGYEQDEWQTDGNSQWPVEWNEGQHDAQHHYPYHQQNFGYHEHGGMWPSLDQQLAESVSREHELLDHVQNLTGTINSMRQLDTIHTRQMDVLTERIMAAEAQIAMEQNRALEAQANCTELAREIAVLHDELSEWQSRCANFADENEKNEERIKELKRDLDEARASAENLAISIENSRIRDQLDGSRRKKKRSRGVLSWILSFLAPATPEDEFDEDQSPRVR